MESWLRAALDYIPSWLDFQMRMSEQPGCIIAVVHRDQVVLDRAFGYADLTTGQALTPRHRFRVASHSKSFTATGIMKLCEAGKLRLDDPVGQHVRRVHPRIAETTLRQVLSHSAGLTRDGADAGQFSGRRPFLDAEELLADLRMPPAIDPNTRFKYSNHGFGLLGLVIEAVTDDSFAHWIRREVIKAAGLKETEPDMPLPAGTPFARGHSSKVLLGRRLSLVGDYRTNAIAPAGGVVSTASDLARFFAQLAPNAKDCVLSVASRREMTRRHWRNPHSSQEGYYGLGTISGTLGGWDWFGHAGGLEGYISRTCVVADRELSISMLTNATDGWAGYWLDGVLHILRGFAVRGGPSAKLSSWNGRWWSNWGAADLVPTANIVLIANPHAGNPFLDASEIVVTGKDKGRIALAGGYGSHGEPVRLARNAAGTMTELWLAGSRLAPEARIAAEMQAQHKQKPARRRRATQGR